MSAIETAGRLASAAAVPAAVAAGSAALLWASASLLRPDLSRPPAPADPAEVRALREARATALHPENPPVLQRDVDYAEGPAAAWYPKGEPPLLSLLVKPAGMGQSAFEQRLREAVAAGQIDAATADLARANPLPPVAERTGPEPVVIEGPDGVGRHGGVWISGGQGDMVGILANRMSASTLVRWSPEGYPIVPHIARRWEVSAGADGRPDYRAYTFWLRKGMKWSDGHPFTADDILYWWEHEASDKGINGTYPPLMTIGGQPGRVEKLADDCVRFTFPEPHGLFLVLAASARGLEIVGSPAHYLRQYHPTLGDPALIERTLRARCLNDKVALYRDHIKKHTNPEHPRLWPWIYRTYSPNPPYNAVRNPYYWAVDTRGNQLPYVDGLHFVERSRDMIAVSIANGEFATASVKFQGEEYGQAMANRDRGGYDVYHWYRADRAYDTVSVNLNLRTDYDDPRLQREALNKARLLRDKRFRQALSLAIDRAEIIEAMYNGVTEPAQVGPGPGSYFYHPRLFKSFTAFDPARAGALLDELGLTRRDYEGFREFADGTRMTFFVNFCTWYRPPAPALFMVEHWARVGVRVIPRMIDNNLFYKEKAALLHELSIFPGDSEHEPLIEPRTHVPVTVESNWAIGYATWWMRGGLRGMLNGVSMPPGCIEPTPGDEAGREVRRAMEYYAEICRTGDRARQKELYDRIQDIAAEQVWTISVCTMPPTPMIVKRGFRNVPRMAVTTFNFISPGNTAQEAYFFESPESIPGMDAQLRASVMKVTPPPEAVPVSAAAPADATGRLGRVVRGLLGFAALGFVALAALRHPYIGRRLLIMVPTLGVVSLVVFFIIQLPPGDYLTSRIMELQMKGDQVDLRQIEQIREAYHLDKPFLARYAYWLGLPWFATLRLDAAPPYVRADSQRGGLLQGNLGRTMEDGRLVNQVVGDRVMITVLLSLGTILFTWAVAIPIGIYSAVRQYTFGDYFFTFVGFVGMCVPSFLLALLLMFVSQEWFGAPISGLFSARYGAQPGWDAAKTMDLLRHLWVPVVILGVSGTAGMIRVLRANLLDELRKPYVVTARAKGVRPAKLLFKYPVRLALNPFISGIGGLFPYLLSGATIVSVVLSLPTVGPLMLDALMKQDMYLAGSMLMILSLLGVVGVLVSDLLLLWLDPRIRYEGSK